MHGRLSTRTAAEKLPGFSALTLGLAGEKPGFSALTQQSTIEPASPCAQRLPAMRKNPVSYL
jgi:hypothetical protein